MSFADRFRWCLITSFGLGCSPWAPGTVGTLGGVLLAITLQWLLPGDTLVAWGIAAAVLFKMKVTPVVVGRYDFGGDNHADDDRQRVFHEKTLGDLGAAAQGRSPEAPLLNPRGANRRVWGRHCRPADMPCAKPDSAPKAP